MLNRTNDYFFAKVFGDPKHKFIALSLMNAVFETAGTETLADIEFVDRTMQPNSPDGKLSRLDILGRTADGVKVNVEMQVVNEHNIERRTLYYWAKLYADLARGQGYSELTRTVTINLLAFRALPDEECHSVYGLCNWRSGERLLEDMEIHFVELPKWKPSNLKAMKRLDRWLAYFTQKVSKEEMEEIAMREPAIREAMQAESLFTQSDIERREYEQREKAIRDYHSAMEAATRIGLEKGMEEGLEKGLEKGMEKGIEKGMEKAMEKIASNMLRMGLAMEVVQEATGMRLERLERLKAML